ncbi:glycosyltransferase [Sporolactobacillus sp. CQH2019]|uniref:glycosyltransferase n=1 Tax=Sporolactobacillus sp. CQH2019 TaxID=3023512 RepID=UPI002367BD73|nr:glycosyltransferase [Sporolactobacillus sp. CQH2019]MDD9148214.1 glycosyltransferase [Sporolactobacillus sp. CQH2019]
MGIRVWMHPKFNPTNKYNDLLSRSLENEGVEVREFSFKKIAKMKRGDVVHFHWIDSYYQKNNRWSMLVKSKIFFSFLYILKLRGIKLVWTVHNLYPHDYKWPGLEKKIRAQMMRLCDKLIVAADSIKQEVVKEFGIAPEKIEIILHGHYYGAYPAHHLSYRKKYNIDENRLVFLFVGAVKEYKGVIPLLTDFTNLDDRNSNLIIAGKVYDGLEKSIMQFKGKNGVILDLRFIPDEELADLILSSDFVVLPFKNITTSGSAILAASLRKKIICPSTPFMKEYFNDSIAIMYDGSDTNGLWNALKGCMSDRKNKDIPDAAYRAFLSKLSWKKAGENIKNLYLSL